MLRDDQVTGFSMSVSAKINLAAAALIALGCLPAVAAGSVWQVDELQLR